MDFKEVPILNKAQDFAAMSLAGQKRKSGEDIVIHCQRVADNLVRFKVSDPATIAAALLHHSLSEGAANLADIKLEFGEDIASMVEAFETLRIIRLKAGMQDEFVENLRKMFLVLAKDLRVVLVKLADILDNLTTLDSLQSQKRQQVARETLEVFAPLADRLGMSEMKGILQDLAFKYTDSEGFDWVEKTSGKRLASLGKTLIKVKTRLSEDLGKSGISAEIQSRVKHKYSLYTKLHRPGIAGDITKIHDLIAMRVLVESEEECYLALDIIRQIFKLLPFPISDYIAHPKPNGYRSIHLWVNGPSNIPFEIQIRTKKMHEQAEYGVAAHWNYAQMKESGMSDEVISQGFATSAEKLDWVKRLSKWQEELSDNQEFLKTIKTDFFGERIFVFTPKGDVKDLPKGATPVDFAYMVHTDLGDLVTGAKVNGKMVPLNINLHNADVVEVLVSKDKHKKPNRDWLEFVVTGIAKKKIKKDSP